MNVDDLVDALDSAAGCNCCASLEKLADLARIVHCDEINSYMCDFDEDWSGDNQCEWHRREMDFRSAAKEALRLYRRVGHGG